MPSWHLSTEPDLDRVVRITNWANGSAFSRLAEWDAGSAIDRIDDSHVLDRVLQRRLRRFAAQHHRGEKRQANTRRRRAAGSALHDCRRRIGPRADEKAPSDRAHAVDRGRQPPWRSTATDPTTTSSSGPSRCAHRKQQLALHRPVHLRTAQFRLCRNDFEGRTAERANMWT
jgi:hypothetical protein